MAEAQLADADVDLLDSANLGEDVLSAVIQLARSRFAEQLAKAKIPSSFVRQARLSVTRSSESHRGPVNGRWCDGHTFTIAVRVVSDHGKTFEDTASIFVAPHNATIERRSIRST
jgi:hypothetical protein